MKKIAVIGSRAHPNLLAVDEMLEKKLSREDTLVISGGASGVDTRAYQWCRDHKIGCAVIVPDYHTYGVRAPLVRNEWIAELADEAYVFWNGESRGTEHAIKQFTKRKKATHVWVARFE